MYATALFILALLQAVASQKVVEAASDKQVGIVERLLNITIFSGAFWLLVFVYYSSKFVIMFTKRKLRRQKWAKNLQRKHKYLSENWSFEPQTDGVLSKALQLKIVQSDIEGLKKIIWEGEATSEQVTRFFLGRAKTVGIDLRAVCDSNYTEAIALAQRADETLKRSTNKSTLPLLLGIPFSVKEIFYMKGFDITHGLESRIGKPYNHNCPLVQHFIDSGAIPFVRTNIPQILMTFESDNPIYGRCLNPHNNQRTAGGSSGGEGALISAGCSPFGLGSDIGGSIRIPSLFCGIFGFLPTQRRLEWKQNAPDIDCYFKEDVHQDFIRPTTGPMAKSVSDLKTLMKVFADPKINSDINRSLPPLPWREDATQLKAGQKLKIGYFESLDEVFEASQANRRAVGEVVQALRKAGHEVVPFKIPHIEEIFSLTAQFFVSDGANLDNLSFSNGITLLPAYRQIQIMMLLPTWLKKGVAWLLEKAGMRRLAIMLVSTCLLTSDNIYIRGNIQLYFSRIVQMSMTDQGITHLIAPGMGTPAVKHGTTGDLLPDAVYTTLFNFFQMPTGAIPVTRVREDEQHYSSHHNDPTTEAAKDCMIGSAGLPIGVQVVAQPFHDEECLALMGEIERTMGLKAMLAPVATTLG